MTTETANKYWCLFEQLLFSFSSVQGFSVEAEKAES